MAGKRCAAHPDFQKKIGPKPHLMSMFSTKKALNIWNQSVARATQPHLWSTGLLILSSAALGGIAVALWNRQALQKMRSPESEGETASPQRPGEFFEEE
jgi:hypothetical protein